MDDALSNFRLPMGCVAVNGGYRGTNASVHLCANVGMYFQRPASFRSRQHFLQETAARLEQGGDPCADLRSYYAATTNASTNLWPVLTPPPLAAPDWQVFSARTPSADVIPAALYNTFLRGDVELVDLLVSKSKHRIRPNQVYFINVGVPGRPCVGTLLTASIMSPCTSVALVSRALQLGCHPNIPCFAGKDGLDDLQNGDLFGPNCKVPGLPALPGVALVRHVHLLRMRWARGATASAAADAGQLSGDLYHHPQALQVLHLLKEHGADLDAPNAAGRPLVHDLCMQPLIFVGDAERGYAKVSGGDLEDILGIEKKDIALLTPSVLLCLQLLHEAVRLGANPNLSSASPMPMWRVLDVLSMACMGMTGVSAAASGGGWLQDMRTEKGPVSAFLRCILAILHAGGMDFTPVPFQGISPTMAGPGGFDSSHVNTALNTYLNAAVQAGAAPIVRFALTVGKQHPNARSPAATKSTLLIGAAILGSASMVRLLLQLGADPRLTTAIGDITAMGACTQASVAAPPGSFGRMQISARGGQHDECMRLLQAALDGRALDEE